MMKGELIIKKWRLEEVETTLKMMKKLWPDAKVECRTSIAPVVKIESPVPFNFEVTLYLERMKSMLHDGSYIASVGDGPEFLLELKNEKWFEKFSERRYRKRGATHEFYEF